MYRPSLVSSFAWTKSSLQFGHAALAISRSRAVSTVQSSPDGGADGKGDVAPFWLTIFKHPLATVQAASP
jgi:hypothetical protein